MIIVASLPRTSNRSITLRLVSKSTASMRCLTAVAKTLIFLKSPPKTDLKPIEGCGCFVDQKLRC